MDIRTSDVVTFATDLISEKSITPKDGACQKMIADRLSRVGFHCEHLRFGEVNNLYARFGKSSPLLVFVGHTDVVPTGPESDWVSPPFEPEVRDGLLYGRGACDMKGAVAAMVIAGEKFVRTNPNFEGSIAYLITSDEEGPSLHGTKEVVRVLKERNEKIHFCVIGEPSSEKVVGDQIRVGRRGSLSARLVIHGKQGHVAHPHLAKNPIHMCLLALAELTKTEWDKGNQDFPPTTFQISNIHAGTGAYNVIPGHLEVLFNFRFSTALSVEQLKERIEDILGKHQLNFDIEWSLGAKPFLTKHGELINAVQEAIKEVSGLTVKLSTGGGTSDGRFIAEMGAEIVELGVPNLTAHHVNEFASVLDLETLVEYYNKILEKVFL